MLLHCTLAQELDWIHSYRIACVKTALLSSSMSAFHHRMDIPDDPGFGAVWWSLRCFWRLWYRRDAIRSDLAIVAGMLRGNAKVGRKSRSLAAQRVHFGQHFGGFGLKRVALLGKVIFRIFAGLVLKVEVAEVVVDDFFALAEVVEACFFDDSGQLRLRPEDIGEAGEKQYRGSNNGLEIHGNRSDAKP